MPHFYQAHIKGIKSDFVKGEIAIGFVVDFDEENAELARELSRYAEAAAGDVEITITPRQISLFDKAPQVTEEETVPLPADDPEDPLDDDLLTPDEDNDVLPLMEEDIEEEDIEDDDVLPLFDDVVEDAQPLDESTLPDVGPWEEEEFEEETEEV